MFNTHTQEFAVSLKDLDIHIDEKGSSAIVRGIAAKFKEMGVEKELINHLASYTNEIISAAKDYDPTKVTRYVTQLATLFHKFYNACRVKGEEEGLMQARLALCNCVRAVIKNVLTMFNISCPESM